MSIEERNSYWLKKFRETYSLSKFKDKMKEKNKLSYLPWTVAWNEFKQLYPTATYEIKKDEQEKCYFGDENIGYFVYTSITVEDLTYEMQLPVMDGANKSMKLNPYKYKVKAYQNNGDWEYTDIKGSIKIDSNFKTKYVDAISSFDINTSIMRCLVKNMAMFGFGMFIYEGEDIPEDINEYCCVDCGNPFLETEINGKVYSSKEIYTKARTMSSDQQARCKTCREKFANAQLESTNEIDVEI